MSSCNGLKSTRHGRVNVEAKSSSDVGCKCNGQVRRKLCDDEQQSMNGKHGSADGDKAGIDDGVGTAAPAASKGVVARGLAPRGSLLSRGPPLSRP